MSDRDPTPEEIRASIVPKSDQLNADDLLTGPITVTIDRASSGSKEQPLNVHLVGYDRVFRPCKTMRKIMVGVWSEYGKTWPGNRMTLYCDPNVKYGGVRVGGIRISHMSGLTEPKTFIISESKSRRVEVTIQPLVDTPPENQQQIAEAKALIAEAASAEALKAVGFALKQKSKAVQDAVRPIYVQRQKELAGTTADPELEKFLAAIADLKSPQACGEFRELVLSTVPQRIKQPVNDALALREAKLKKEEGAPQ